MKKILAVLATLLALASCSSEYYVYSSFHEPATDGLRYLYSKDGMRWDSIPGTWLRPEVGKQKVLRDPSIQQTPDGTYHLVWTSSWRGDRGFGYASSRDLRHWSKERFIEVMPDTTTVNVWAPELFYDESHKDMMIFWASCIPHKFSRGTEEEDNNHRLYYTTTRDFIHFTPTKLFLDPGFSCIDAMIVKLGEKRYAMVLKDNTRSNRNLKVAFAAHPQGPWSPVSDSFSEEFVEGPAVAKVRKGYIIYADRYRKHDFAAYFTRDFKHFKEISDKTIIPEGHKHGTIFRASNKE